MKRREKRLNFVTIRLDDGERRFVEQLAITSNKSFSEIVREGLFSVKKKQAKNTGFTRT